MKRRDRERETVEKMIRIYCRRKEGNRELCADCRELIRYAAARLSSCRYGDAKPTCRQCPVHCYRADMKVKIQEVMRYAGPRMLFFHPLAAVGHLLREMRRDGTVR